MNPSEMRVLKIGNDIICTKMKRLGTLISITALLVACQSEQEDPSVITRPAISQEEAESVFYGTMETGQETKVYADEYLNVRWNANDKVSIFAKQDINQEYRFAGDDGANAGEFARGSQEGTGTGSSLPYNYAIYPYSSATSISAEGVLSVVLPADQTYKADSFGPGASTMVAVSEDNNLLFKNVGAFVSINLYGDDVAVSRITLKGHQGEKLAGSASIQMAPGGTPVLTMSDENVFTTITLVCADPIKVGADAEHATSFWMVLPPTKFDDGFTVTVEDSNGRCYMKSTSKEIEFTRSKLKRMKAFDCAVLEFGLYPVSGESFFYDPTTDQMNIYEAVGNAWFRFLRVPDLTMYELGPIALDQTEWENGISTQLVVWEDGVAGLPVDFDLSVLSYQGGILNLVSGNGDQFVLRF